ncbi:ankyrin repeat-containing protein ITN1-like [Panicum hallii]|uniref:ankyrin repeat-containing protein ITN1-like n=1 Tax=Panicum hallii TaxID=206008 RepID=UPI000DF4D75E|nr:ankyrin repeat-containing protein ITN1-like [Panicum hallii]
MLDYSWVDQEFLPSSSLNGTPLHQAVLGGHLKIVEILLDKRPHLIDLADFNGDNALHLAAQKNHRRVVEMLLNKRAELAYKINSRSESPLHIAVRNGSTDAIKALLRHCPDAAEMANGQGWNAFHVSVASGKTSALSCLLRHIHPPELLNYADSDGDTPLHLAANMGHVRSALLLLNDQRVNPCIRDRGGHTARSLLETKLLTDGELHPDEMYLLEQLEKHESKRCRKDQVPPVVILSSRRRPLNDKDFDKVVDAYFIAATLIATVTFAATFTMPGGYDQTRGIALHGRNAAFMTFVVSNTVAMCSSIVVIFLLIWARQEPVMLRIHNVMWSQTLTIVACLAMLVALMTAVYITVAPTAPWPAYAVIAIGTSSPALFFFISWLGRRSLYAGM